MGRVVAFLQNQWFKDPERAKRLLARYGPDRRHEFVKDMLFLGCLTGKRIEKAFGDLCDGIIFEDVSPEIGGKAASCFPADFNHVLGVLDHFKPEVVLAFGKIAAGVFLGHGEQWANVKGRREFHVICGPHPAARHATVLMDLEGMATALRTRLG